MLDDDTLSGTPLHDTRCYPEGTCPRYEDYRDGDCESGHNATSKGLGYHTWRGFATSRYNPAR